MHNKKKINPKDALALRMKLEGASNPEIAKALGHKSKSNAVASAVVSKRLKRAKESESLTDILDKYGATDQAIIETAVAALSAERVISAHVIIKSADPTVKSKTADGRDVDFIEVPDFDVRLKAAALLGKWKGWEKLTLTGAGGGPIQIEGIADALAKVYGRAK